MDAMLRAAVRARLESGPVRGGWRRGLDGESSVEETGHDAELKGSEQSGMAMAREAA